MDSQMPLGERPTRHAAPAEMEHEPADGVNAAKRGNPASLFGAIGHG